LRATSGRKAEARKLLDDVISWQSEIFPTSAQNQFLEQRMQLATNLSEFLKFAPRRPAAFYEEGQIGKLTDFLDARKSSWSEDVGQTKEEYEKSSEDYFRELLPWDDRLVFEEKTVDTLNWHFPLQLLKQAASEPGLPDYLRRRLMLAVWTRAILLKNEPVAQKTATDIISLAPELKSLFLPYLKAQGDVEKQHAALYILLKQPMLSPFVTGGLPVTQSSEELDYYFETSWWCPLAETEYNDEANEVPKVISKPWFLTAEQFAAAAKERAALSNIGDAKSYLGKRVIEWARLSPADERLPEALFIAAKANGQYKYGCSGWEYDQPTRTKLETILREKYPQSLWAAKLLEVPE
jgi:hypothetical protein